MRILAGAMAGRDLVSPAGRVRPTAEEVRGAWMDALAADLKGARVLELFAGTGALGLEAISRGASRCDFVENNPSALHSLKANVTSLRVREWTRIFKRDAVGFWKGLEAGAYDLVLADPPYGSGLLEALIADWKAKPFAPVLSVEHSAVQVVPRGGKALRCDTTVVTTYRNPRSV